MTKTAAFGGYTIDFKGRKETAEDIFGSKPIPPSEMTKLIWVYVKANKLSNKPEKVKAPRDVLNDYYISTDWEEFEMDEYIRIAKEAGATKDELKTLKKIEKLDEDEFEDEIEDNHQVLYKSLGKDSKPKKPKKVKKSK